MYAPKYRLEAIETIGRKILLEYDRTLLEGPPQAIPIETIIETKFNLTLEYHTLRKNGSVLGETILMTEQPFYMTEQRGNTFDCCEGWDNFD